MGEYQTLLGGEEEDIVELDVAVDDALAVNMLQGTWRDEGARREEGERTKKLEHDLSERELAFVGSKALMGSEEGRESEGERGRTNPEAAPLEDNVDAGIVDQGIEDREDEGMLTQQLKLHFPLRLRTG